MTHLPDIITHATLGHYNTRQQDGVHIEARCICGAKLEGVGNSEQAAWDMVRVLFEEHKEGELYGYGSSNVFPVPECTLVWKHLYYCCSMKKNRIDKSCKLEHGGGSNGTSL